MIISSKTYCPVDITKAAAFILSVQKENGEIPWFVNGKTDHWDHVENAMGLTVAGHLEPAKNAYLWSRRTQLPDGSWWAEYERGRPVQGTYQDTNMTAYIAVGIYHYYLATGDIGFVNELWPTVRRALDFVVGMQLAQGQISWARSNGRISPEALLTASSSIHFSLWCGLHLASLMGVQKTEWYTAKLKLRQAIRYQPYLFDQSKSRFSMDWYYPVLCGVVRREEAERRFRESWDLFTMPGWGVRCVSDQPWLTMAETAEFTMALAAIGDYTTAGQVFSWIQDKCDPNDGSFLTGITYPDRVVYPEENTTWTAAAVLLAADMLYDLTPAGRLFSHSFMNDDYSIFR